MATIVLGAVGTLVGGPIGGAVGALIGRQADSVVFGSPSREGPRLTELAVTTSSYGSPIPRHFGRMRSPGSIIWATDLVEAKETSGGKGKPKTTTYSYSMSFAVALASRPIEAVGRIWADGNLLRGASGDLKVGGQLRIYEGTADQQPDPLLVADQPTLCPAYRGLAYAVFEDLQLAEFGNRVPALTFEVVADGSTEIVAALMETEPEFEAAGLSSPSLTGFSHDRGSYRQVLETIDSVLPLVIQTDEQQAAISGVELQATSGLLPDASSWDDGDFGRQSGSSSTRKSVPSNRIGSLRYYDIDRDYQLGLQRTLGRSSPGRDQQVDFPGTLSATAARTFVDDAATRAGAQSERISWRTTELNPDLTPGTLIGVPNRSGLWRILEWEWRSGGVEIELERFNRSVSQGAGAAAGSSWKAPDTPIGVTFLRAFELPPATSETSGPVSYLASGSAGGLWRGATLYQVRANELLPIGAAGPAATAGILVDDLGQSSATIFEAASELKVSLLDASQELESVTLAQLASGGNKLHIGGEIIQFRDAEPLGGGVWRLSGLLRGRAGTEDAAMLGHAAGSQITLLDDTLTALSGDDLGGTLPERFAAIGINDETPVISSLENAGLSTRPLAPVHGRMRINADGSVSLSWIRRARGAWAWRDHADTPLVEQFEAYEVGVGDPASPARTWTANDPSLTIFAADFSEITSANPGASMWVVQVGDYGRSLPTMLGAIPS